MSNQEIIFLLSGIVVFLVAINFILLWYFYKTNKKIDKLLENGKIKEFRDIFLSQKDKNSDLEEKIKKVFLKIKDIEGTCQTTFQKIGVVRFNPFESMGGNQSFVIALLDARNNGFLISSLFVKDGNRVYAKILKDGKSDHALSKEEVEAVNRAINLK
jgi:hypothetical protein